MKNKFSENEGLLCVKLRLLMGWSHPGFKYSNETYVCRMAFLVQTKLSPKGYNKSQI